MTAAHLRKQHGDYLMGYFYGHPIYGYMRWIDILSRYSLLQAPQPPSLFLPDLRLWYCRYCGLNTWSDKYNCCSSCGAPKQEEAL